jgi:hypothetical protein
MTFSFNFKVLSDLNYKGESGTLDNSNFHYFLENEVSDSLIMFEETATL